MKKIAGNFACLVSQKFQIFLAKKIVSKIREKANIFAILWSFPILSFFSQNSAEFLLPLEKLIFAKKYKILQKFSEIRKKMFAKFYIYSRKFLFTGKLETPHKYLVFYWLNLVYNCNNHRIHQCVFNPCKCIIMCLIKYLFIYN